MDLKVFKRRNENIKEDINILIQYKEKSKEVEKFIEYIKEYNKEEKIIVRKDYEDIVIKKTEILYFFSDKKYNYCKTMEDIYKVKSKLYEIEKEKDYLRISKSHVINIEKIEKFNQSITGEIQAIMKDGSKIIVSRRRVKDVKDFLDERSI